MSLIVNDEKIDNSVIENEVERLRPDYQAVFKDQTPEEQEAQLHEWAKENVIERFLIQQQAQNDPIDIPAEKIDTAYHEMKQQHGGEEKFYEKFRLTKADDDKIKKDIELQLRVERLLDDICKDLPKPTEKQARKYYNDNLEQFTSPEQVRAAHIVKHIDGTTNPSQAKQAILKVQKELKSDKSFEELAVEYSDCPDNGGDLGYFPRGQMVQSFDDVVFSLQKNQISDVFRTEYGYHIAKLIDRKPSKPINFDEIKENIINQLHEQNKTKAVENFVDELKEKADITHFAPEQRENSSVKSAAKPEQTTEKETKQLNSILVKPAGPDCNMACSYCFYLEKADLFSETKMHRMSEQVLEEMIRQAMTQCGPDMSFGWQGGEPTLMGLPFFEKAIEFQQRYGHGQTVGNGLQTNGILINDNWAKFLKDYDFLVGLSLDGPQHIHDRYRLMKSGKGSYARVVDRAKLMLDREVAVNALSVVNDYSVQFPQQIYEFHKELGLTYMQFIPCVETDPHNPAKAAPFSVPAEKYGEFLCTLFDLWVADFKDNTPSTSIRYFDSVFHHYVEMPPPECTLLPACGIYVVVEHNGNVYSCDFFVEAEWQLGNIMDNNLTDMLNSERQHEFGMMKANLPEPCMNCEWLKYCWGGCTKDRIRDAQDNNLNHFCDSYKMFFAHSDEKMQQLAENWKREQTKTSRQDAILESIKKGEIKVSRNDPCPCGSGKKFKKCCGMYL